jgi:myosin heavy subunit
MQLTLFNLSGGMQATPAASDPPDPRLARIEKGRQQLTDVVRGYLALTEVVAELEEDKKVLKSANEQLKEDNKVLSNENAELRSVNQQWALTYAELEESDDELKKLNAELEKSNAELEKLNAQYQVADKEFAELEKLDDEIEKSTAELEKSNAELKKLNADLLRANADQAAEFKKLDNEHKALKAQFEEVLAAQTADTQELNAARVREERSTLEYSRQVKINTDLEAQLHKLTSDLKQQQKIGEDHCSLRKEIRSAEQYLKTKRSKISSGGKSLQPPALECKSLLAVMAMCEDMLEELAMAVPTAAAKKTTAATKTPAATAVPATAETTAAAEATTAAAKVTKAAANTTAASPAAAEKATTALPAAAAKATTAAPSAAAEKATTADPAEEAMQALQALQGLQAFHNAAVDAQKQTDAMGLSLVRAVQAFKLSGTYVNRARTKEQLSVLDLRALMLVTLLLQQLCDVAVSDPAAKFLLQLLLLTCPIRAIEVFIGAGKQCPIATDAIKAITQNVADSDVVIKYVNALVKYANQIGGVSARFPVETANAMMPNPIIDAAYSAKIGTSYLDNSTPIPAVVLINLVLARVTATNTLFNKHFV